MVEAKLPPGFRFHPRDEELVCDYLMKKVQHNDSLLLIDVDLNKCEPWDIPGEQYSAYSFPSYHAFSNINLIVALYVHDASFLISLYMIIRVHYL